MKISELIKELQKLQSENGDVEVVVQYRDFGGLYSGRDDDLEPFFDNEKREVVL